MVRGRNLQGFRTRRAWGLVRSGTERADITAHRSSVGISQTITHLPLGLFFDLNASHEYLSTFSTTAKHLFTFSYPSSIYLDTYWLLTEQIRLNVIFIFSPGLQSFSRSFYTCDLEQPELINHDAKNMLYKICLKL